MFEPEREVVFLYAAFPAHRRAGIVSFACLYGDVNEQSVTEHNSPYEFTTVEHCLSSPPLYHSVHNKAPDITTCVWKNRLVLHADKGERKLRGHTACEHPWSVGQHWRHLFLWQLRCVCLSEPLGGCSNMAATVSLLSGLHVSRPLSTWNPSSSMFLPKRITCLGCSMKCKQPNCSYL